MTAIQIQTTRPVIPQIYAYTTPEIHRHDGWTKIGYTEQDVATRIHQQTHTADIYWKLEWHDNAVYQGTVEQFTDKEFHSYLRKQGVAQEKGKNNEWFHISPDDSEEKFYKFRKTRGTDLDDVVIPYTLRDEQEDAVAKTVGYAETHDKGEFLWNAKPRFGKTLSTYDLMKKLNAKTVLIVTNRPAIANSWYDDYKKFVGQENGFLFVSEVDALKERAGVLSRSKLVEVMNEETKYIEFVSLQDMKGSIYFGGHYDKLRELSQQYGMEWDLLVIDEAHEGVDTYKTDIAFDQIKRKFTLHLSGTPFKALANNKFGEDAIYNWTYADEQAKKRDWRGDDDNPYSTLPKLNLFTYQMSEIVREDIKQGVEINGETVEYAFDLNEFFRVNNNGQFVYSESVDRFLEALVTQEKFPFSTEELRGKLKHTFWLLNRVDSAKALAKKLQNHPVFKDYEIVLAAGDGKIDDDDENKKSFDKVREAIKEHDKTITLSVGQLTTGVTIPEWTAVLMLSNVKSPALYMQAAFRAQNPCLFATAEGFERKENAYVFDFDPARTLIIFEEFANDLSSNTASGRGTVENRKENIRTLLNFFPVIGEDKDGEMVELDAEQVLLIPRKIKSVEVVRRGFMSDFLFANISHVFAAPKEVQDIINQFEAVQAPKEKVNLAPEVKEELSLNEAGEVELSNEHVIGQAAELFGDKVYGEKADEIVDEVVTVSHEDASAKLKSALDECVKQIVDKTAEEYELKPREKEKLKNQLSADSARQIEKAFGQHKINTNVIEREREEALQNSAETGESEEDINDRFDKKQKANQKAFAEDLHSKVDKIVSITKEEAVRTAETNKKQKEKDAIEDGIRDHLRGFSRTIPSFLMAYGDNAVTLATFDTIIPDKVFKEVTSITLDQFRFLRDGGEYIDSETGEQKHFNGQLFNSVVFDDSVKEFLALKKKLADYFDEKAIEDIFDYIPPQKTNQIFTPKMVVKRMVDMLEKENPGCFDLPDKTFIDLYMKSGLYISEIVKRLYRSEKMKQLYPEKEERLRHIFEKQVYGLAPTEIIYKIAISYILGFDNEVVIPKHNFRQADALPYAKEGKLQDLLNQLYD
jgi:superfamily II DNA or RNA helicase